MDGSAKELALNGGGVCNFCEIAQKELALAEKEKPNLPYLINNIKKNGEGKQYDILIGLSGGVDSSTALVKAVELGLRPLAFTVDNGWNDSRADENIMRLVETLKIPFYRYTINLERFADLQNAFLKAGLINAEIPTDHILMATSLEMADKYGIKWILSGGNVATESVMPPSWSYNARDLTHIKDVYRKMTGKKLKDLPLCGIWKWNYYKWVRGIKTFYLLDYLDYNRTESIKMLEENFGYKSYGDKHEESHFTKWFQNFYLFTKFGIDKRKAHYSSMINSGQMTRSEAMQLLLERPVYPLLGLEARVMKYSKREHSEFKQDKVYGRIARIVKMFQ